MGSSMYDDDDSSSMTPAEQRSLKEKPESESVAMGFK